MYSEKVMDHFNNPRNVGETEKCMGVMGDTRAVFEQINQEIDDVGAAGTVASASNWMKIMKEMGATHMKVREKLPMQAQAENPYKKMLRIAVRKIVPNNNDPKHAFAKRCYNAAIRVYGK